MSSNLFWSKGTDKSQEGCVYVISYSGFAVNEYGERLPPFYIGSRYTNLMENYYGSLTSKRWSKIWRKESRENPHLFKRRIIKTFDTRKEASDYEEEILKRFNAARSDFFVNLHNGGSKGWISSSKGISWSEERKKLGIPKARGPRPHTCKPRPHMRIPRGPNLKLRGRKQSEEQIAHKSKKGSLQDPRGEIHHFDQIKSFCKENNLSTSCVQSVISGKRKSHKGWTRVGETSKRKIRE